MNMNMNAKCQGDLATLAGGHLDCRSFNMQTMAKQCLFELPTSPD